MGHGRDAARAAKARTRTKQKTSFTILPFNWFLLLRGDLLLAATELGLSGYCEQAPFKAEFNEGFPSKGFFLTALGGDSFKKNGIFWEFFPNGGPPPPTPPFWEPLS